MGVDGVCQGWLIRTVFGSIRTWSSSRDIGYAIVFVVLGQHEVAHVDRGDGFVGLVGARKRLWRVGETHEDILVFVIVRKGWHGGDGHACEIFDSEFIMSVDGKGDGRSVVRKRRGTARG